MSKDHTRYSFHGSPQGWPRLRGISALPPDNGHHQAARSGPFRARNGLMHRSNYVPSLDHLAGAAEQREGNGQTERLCGLEVEDQLDLGHLLHRQVRA